MIEFLVALDKRGPLGIDRQMTTLKAMVEKTRKTLAAARRLDTSGTDDESKETRTCSAP